MERLWAVIVVGFALGLSAGCLSTESLECGPGLICPGGSVCDLANDRCVTSAQLGACATLEEGADCSYLGGVGRCDRGACVISVCGNSTIELGEVCDDGNRLDLDGCRNDCRSDESCGNGVIDSILGELCDDNNFASHDGCTATCTLEFPGWGLLQTPARRTLAAMAFDIGRGQMVVFGGFDADFISAKDDTWFLDGDRWLPGPAPAPDLSARWGAAMVYDAAHQRVVLFGGQTQESAAARLAVNDSSTFCAGSGPSYAGDTWFLESDGWKPGPVSGPLPRSDHALAYDSKRGRSVLFGGHRTNCYANASAKGDDIIYANSNETYGDTWLLQDTTWIAGPAAPPGLSSRWGHAMAYDPKRDRVVLFGGEQDNGIALHDTWFFENNTWVPGPSAPPELSARYDHELVYDAKRDQVVLFGGGEGSGHADTWILENDAWVPGAAPPSGLSPRTGHSMGYDTKDHRVVLFGGTDTGTGLGKNDSWFWDGTTWQAGPQFAPLGPSGRIRPSIAYDTKRGHVVVFGGIPPAPPFNDTWILDGQAWTKGPDLSEPQPRSDASLVYDAERDHLVLFGGSSNSDTWFLENGAWVSGPAAPPELTARRDQAMAYDSKRKRIVLFGGYRSFEYKNDTWFLDGDGWHPGPAAPPELTARSGHTLEYDVKRDRIVLFGGEDSETGRRNDTWFLQADTWVKGPPPASGLRARSMHAIAYDAAYGQMVVTGGIDRSDKRLNDTWFLGEQWYPGPPAPQRAYHAMTYDTGLHRLLLFAGVEVGTQKNDVWVFRYQGYGVEDESCSFVADQDGDGRFGCDDPDCAGFCAGCGDSICDPLESCRNCPGDCGSCIECGDFVCSSPSETSVTCPGDCY